MPLFPELFPLRGGLRPDNRWMKLGRLIPWNQMEEIHRKYFSDRMGRPAKDSRLICGLLVVKHTKGFSDEAVAEDYLENPYVQAFCGEETFVTEGGIDPSLLSKIRKRLGKTFFRAVRGRRAGGSETTMASFGLGSICWTRRWFQRTWNIRRTRSC
jgi:hypothetical protein